MERLRWRREDRTRFHAERYAAYSKFLESGSVLLWAERESEEEEKLIETLREANALIQIIPTQPVKVTAKEYLLSVEEVRMELPKGNTTRDELIKPNYAQRIDAPREDFVKAAR